MGLISTKIETETAMVLMEGKSKLVVEGAVSRRRKASLDASMAESFSRVPPCLGDANNSLADTQLDETSLNQ
jgi:hypothetical protein